jgi:hypothetical protein
MECIFGPLDQWCTLRARPHQYAACPIQTVSREYVKLGALKSLSNKDSDGVGRQALITREPSDLTHLNFGLITIPRNPYWASIYLHTHVGEY